MIDQIGGRKVVAAIVTIGVGLTVVLMRGDLPANLLTLLQTVFGAFVVGNGIEHVTDAVQAKADTAAAQPSVVAAPDTSDLEAKLEDLHTQNAALQGAVAKVQETLVAIVQRVFGQPKT